MTKKFITLLALSLFNLQAFSWGTHAKDTPGPNAKAAALKVSNFYARATALKGGNGAFYLTIKNLTNVSDRLIKVEVPATVCEYTELHTHIHEGDIKRMRRVEDMPVSPNSTLKLQPGGLHVMLMKLAQPLREGETFPATLHFEQAGQINITVPVKSVNYKPCGCSAKR